MKEYILQVLKEDNLEELLAVFDKNPNSVRKYITCLSYHQQSCLRQQSIKAFSFLAEKRGRKMEDFFLETIRRHLWGMNDESGNMDWSAPEIIAAIIVAQPKLFSHFASIMIEAALNEPIFEESLTQAVKILQAKDEKLIEYHLSVLKKRGLI